MDANSGPRERITEQIARKLRGELAERRISGRHLAEMTGLSQSTMSRRLTGETPFDLDELEVVCGVLGLDPVELLLRAQQRPRPDGPDGGVEWMVRHQGLEPRTRWFGVTHRRATGVVIPLQRRGSDPVRPLTAPDRRAA